MASNKGSQFVNWLIAAFIVGGIIAVSLYLGR